MSRQPQPIRSDIAWSTRDRITVRGRDLPNQLLGHMNLGDFAYLQLTGREATPQQSAMLSAARDSAWLTNSATQDQSRSKRILACH